jgi:hypothetical protein
VKDTKLERYKLYDCIYIVSKQEKVIHAAEVQPFLVEVSLVVVRLLIGKGMQDSWAVGGSCHYTFHVLGILTVCVLCSTSYHRQDV